MAEVLDLTLSEDDEDTKGPYYPPGAPGSSSATLAIPVKIECLHHRHHHRAAIIASSAAPTFNNDEDSPKVTIVNGKGFWKSWTRSFKTTLPKLLDLIDNAVDGAASSSGEADDDENDDGNAANRGGGFVGRVHIYPDVHEHQHSSSSTDDHRGEGGKKRHYASTTGLCIRNNSPGKIVPLSEALVVHNTTKADVGEIGENGVGLKQACAALCDMSFVLVKNGSNDCIELGIVAKELQREEGPYLPAFQFSNETSESLRGQMLSLFSQAKHDDVAQCIAKYGAYTSGNGPSLAAGINSLCKRFDDICNNFYGNDYVFEVVLNQIRQDQEEGLLRRALDAQQKITVNQIIKELRIEIPKTYLHIPDTLVFIVDKQELTFKYWHDRLVEFTCFTVKVGSTVPWKQNFEVSDEHPDAYELRLFMGFDRERITNPDVEAETGEKRETKNASLHFYSRKSGRLIKSEPDARHMLGLSSGSSFYASALTVIIDDVGGHLPLHPTKQDISFGQQNKGAIHEENLFAWVGAVTKFYYNYHIKKYNNLKRVLSGKVSQYVDSKLPKGLKTLVASEFTTFDLTFEQYRNTIRVNDQLSEEIIGKDTFFRLLSYPNADTSKKGQKIPRQRLSKRKPPEIDTCQQPMTGTYEKTSKRSKPQPVSYREESDADSGDETKVKEEVNDAHIDLCESSDNEDDDTVRSDKPHDSNVHGGQENETRVESEIKPTTDNAFFNSSVCIERNKILEQTVQQMRDSIEILESENQRLLGELEQKDKVISVLKRRLGINTNTSFQSPVSALYGKGA